MLSSRDWNKLIFYYYADHYVNFKELVNDLYKLYKVRLWMSAVNPASFSPNAINQPPTGIGPGALTDFNALRQEFDSSYSMSYGSDPDPYGAIPPYHIGYNTYVPNYPSIPGMANSFAPTPGDGTPANPGPGQWPSASGAGNQPTSTSTATSDGSNNVSQNNGSYAVTNPQSENMDPNAHRGGNQPGFAGFNGHNVTASQQMGQPFTRPANYVTPMQQESFEPVWARDTESFAGFERYGLNPGQLNQNNEYPTPIGTRPAAYNYNLVGTGEYNVTQGFQFPPRGVTADASNVTAQNGFHGAQANDNNAPFSFQPREM